MIINFVIAYLIGSIPFGLILTRLAGYGDIRAIGSGNIGATNVLRTGNKLLALMTLLLDALKGAMAIIICFVINYYLSPAHEAVLMAPKDVLMIGLFAIAGHIFPVWLKFKGGKGVATALGIMLTAIPYTGLAACAIWLATAVLLRFSSLAALIAMAAAPAVTLYISGAQTAAVNAVISLLVIYRHKDNIRRLLNGTEPKIGQKKGEEGVKP